MTHRLHTLWVCAIACATLPVVHAQTGIAPDGAILHERVPSTGGRGDVPVFVYDPREASELPQEIQVGEHVLPAPSLTAKPGESERAYDDRGRPAPGEVDGHRAPPPPEPRGSLGNAARPDRDTDKESSLKYTASFDPSVVPFKRNRALNRVNEQGHLVLDEGQHVPLDVLGHRVGSGREVFWGSVMVEASADEAIPLPTVAPDSRVLAYETTPERQLQFERDAADNLYARASKAGTFRLVYLIDADRRYFSRALPSEATLADVPKRLVPKLPSALASTGREVARAIGLDVDMPYAKLVDRLVTYFRSFEPGDPPPETGDIYRDLALGKRGICRHRGYAFMITAHALGIPARYVFNEAHVFVEIWVPGSHSGWVRADLGGAAENLTIEGGSSRVRHRPQGNDPFSRPKSYARQLARGSAAGADRVSGMPPESVARSGASGDDARSAPSLDNVRLEAAMTLPPAREGTRPSKVTLTLGRSLSYRGDPLFVSGQVTGTHGGGARAGGTVQVVLRDREDSKVLGLLGVATTDASGGWVVEVAVPPNWPPGSYDVRAEFLGDRSLGPSVSP